MKKSTSFEDDVINDALAFFIQDQGEAFKYECAWHEVRNQAKWLAMYGEGYSKRTKTSASWAYTSSSQSNTTTNCEFYPTSSLQCPMGTKMAKRKAKEKSKETNFDLMEIKAMQELLSQVLTKSEDHIHIKETEVQNREGKLLLMEFATLMKDTTGMTKTQLQYHNHLCGIIKKKYGLY